MTDSTDTKITISQDEIMRLATLAKLKLTDEETELYQKQLSSIIGYIDKLKELDTSSVEATNQVTGLENVLRTDEIIAGNSFTQDEATSNMDNTKGGKFEVNAVFESSE